jgi:hypothetical protein
MKRIRSVKKSLVSSSGGRLQAYPNPANEILTVSLSPETVQVTSSSAPSPNSKVGQRTTTKTVQNSGFTVRIYNALQSVVFEADSQEPQIEIPVRNLSEGFYILHVTQKGTTTRKHIVIKH